MNGGPARITLAITGASGIPYATGLLAQLLLQGCLVNLVISKAGMLTMHQEIGVSLSANPRLTQQKLVESLELVNAHNLRVFGNEDWYAPIASGSSVDDAMVVCPCSMATLAKIANGIGDDLIARSADVVLKERKNLLIVPREMPFSAIHLANMLKLAQLGVAIMPPIPAFYTKPQSISEMIDFVVSRILDQLGLANSLSPRW